jgi:hypothetical protein
MLRPTRPFDGASLTTTALLAEGEEIPLIAFWINDLLRDFPSFLLEMTIVI